MIREKQEWGEVPTPCVNQTANGVGEESPNILRGQGNYSCSVSKLKQKREVLILHEMERRGVAQRRRKETHSGGGRKEMWKS